MALTKAIIFALSFVLPHGAYVFVVSGDLHIEQLLLLKRSFEFLNSRMGCHKLGLRVDWAMHNRYNQESRDNTIIFVEDVIEARDVRPDAIAFNDSVFGKGSHGVHIAVDLSYSYPSLEMMVSSVPTDWTSWDDNILRVMLHELGHGFGLKDNQESAGGIMRAEVNSADYQPVGKSEMEMYISAIADNGFVCL